MKGDNELWLNEATLILILQGWADMHMNGSAAATVKAVRFKDGHFIVSLKDPTPPPPGQLRPGAAVQNRHY